MIYKYIRRYFGIGEGADSLGFVAPPLPPIQPYHSDGMVRREFAATARGRFHIGRDLPAVNIDPTGYGFFDQVLQQPLAEIKGSEK